LFVLGSASERTAVENVVPPEILETLAECGLVDAAAETIVPQAMVIPWEGAFLVADPFPRIESGGAGDLVLWPNPTTRLLMLMTVRKPVVAALDLGSGCGVLSVFGARHCERVIATDLNERAAAFTEFNAWLNGIGNIETRTGDTFVPVDGMKFSLIMANPPFFVTPSSTLVYCENPMDLDGYCRRVVREGAGMLEEGGYLQMTLEWVQVEGQNWRERVAEWFDGSDCDGWVIRSYEGNPDEYALERVKDFYTESVEVRDARYRELVEYYRRKKVERILGGMLIARKRVGQNWLRFDEQALSPNEPAGAMVEDLFATQTLLAGTPDAGLLESKPRLRDGVQLRQYLRPQGGRWAAAGMELAQGGALPASLSVDPAVADFLAKLDGNRSLAEVAREVSAKVGVPVEAVAAQCCAVTRRLANARFLTFE
jgi:methylase of polypeptide subunit release factors